MAKSKAILHKLEFGALVSISALLHLMPLDYASAFMGKAWRFLAPRTKRHVRARAHLMAAYPNMSTQEADKILHKMWEGLGRVAAETVMLDRFFKQPERVQLVDPEGMKAAIGGGNCVFATLHGGNYELVSLHADQINQELAGVYQELSNPLSDTYLVDKRKGMYKRGLFSKGHDTGRKLISILRSGGSTAFVADVRDIRGVRVEFFGQRASATHIPALLARNADIPLMAIRAVRTKGSRYKIMAERVPYPKTGDKKADALAGTQALHDVFERWIREDPSQWMWIIRKWV